MTTDLTPEDLDELEALLTANPHGVYLASADGVLTRGELRLLAGLLDHAKALIAAARAEKVLSEQIHNLREGMEHLRRRASQGDDFDLESDIKALSGG